MADQERFEEDIIRWVLKHYGLFDTRTRFMIMDKEAEAIIQERGGCRLPRPTGLLTFRAFNEFFPEFPFGLELDYLTEKRCNRMTFPKLFVNFSSSPVARAIENVSEYHHHAERFAVVFRCPYQKHVKDTLVAHNGRCPDTSRPGVHCCWRLNQGLVVVMQDLQSFIATVDKMYPDHGWKASALDPEHVVPVTT